ncbi:MAG: hypothetical protein WD042_02910 [Phycisphaeraceae bacterium]
MQNSLDAIGLNPGRIDLSFQGHPGGKTTSVTCRDDGGGMTNLQDLRVVFHTSKTDSHLQRGRMGRGFKEMLCIAQQATVISGSRKIEFAMEDGRRITRYTTLEGNDVAGTMVEMVMPWHPQVIRQLEAYFRGLLPPASVQLRVNGQVIQTREPAHRIQANLTTELFEDGKWIRPSRKTLIELIPVTGDGTPLVYEMGIPVCAVEWTQPLHVNVQQRVPMNPCRDAVASGYLVKVHRVCLPLLLPQMEAGQVLQDWVGAAAASCPPEVQREVISRGFGHNIARSVPKMGVRQFDEDAREIGMKVVDTRQTSGGFREILQQHVPTTREAVDQRNQELLATAAGSSFGTEEAFRGQGRADQQRRRLIEAVGGKEHVQAVMDFARWFCQQLLDGYSDSSICSVKLALLRPVNAVATWSQDDVLTLGIDSSGIWTEPLGDDSLTTLIHETAHHLNAHHGRDFHKEMEILAGRAARIMLTRADVVRAHWSSLMPLDSAISAK